MQSGCSKQRRLISPANLGERLSLQQVAMGDVHYNVGQNEDYFFFLSENILFINVIAR